MELRGGDPGSRRTPAAVDRILNAVLDAGINIIDTSPDYGGSEEHIGGPSPTAATSTSSPASAAARSVNAVAAAAGGRAEHVFTPREHPRRRRAEPAPDAHRPSRPGAVPHQPVARDPRRARRRRRAHRPPRRGQGPLPRHVRHAARTSPDQIDMGVFDAFQIPYSAVEREHEEAITCRGRAGSGTIIRGGVARHARSRRHPAATREFRQIMRGPPGPLETGRHRRPARRHDTAWSSCSGSRSAIPTCTPRSSAPATPSTWPTTWPPPQKGPLAARRLRGRQGTPRRHRPVTNRRQQTRIYVPLLTPVACESRYGRRT